MQIYTLFAEIENDKPLDNNMDTFTKQYSIKKIGESDYEPLKEKFNNYSSIDFLMKMENIPSLRNRNFQRNCFTLRSSHLCATRCINKFRSKISNNKLRCSLPNNEREYQFDMIEKNHHKLDWTLILIAILLIILLICYLKKN